MLSALKTSTQTKIILVNVFVIWPQRENGIKSTIVPNDFLVKLDHERKRMRRSEVELRGRKRIIKLKLRISEPHSRRKRSRVIARHVPGAQRERLPVVHFRADMEMRRTLAGVRSEEHTSELQ